ncbi:MAG: tRNA uridine-5-carboxymethylaminomethyl(34) synthesis enzyme MnmG, partial [Gammaproteobacteria bacterium]|nr:tRNA uridine-5-carboxymethylaminomethyl(34) synthesis enzyme MnmG [Gammaproteobacteria bacterium]
TEPGYSLGLVDDVRWQRLQEKQRAIAAEQARLSQLLVRPQDEAGTRIAKLSGNVMSREQKAIEILARPEIDYQTLVSMPGLGPAVADEQVAEQVEIQTSYSGYIKRQGDEIEKARRNEETGLPETLDYRQVSGLSSEVIEKLNRHKPATIGQASRISGVTPAAVSLLLVHLKRHRNLKKTA